MNERKKLPIWGALLIWGVFCLGVAIYGPWIGFGGRPFAIAVVAFGTLAAVQILCAARDVPERIAARLGAVAAWAAAILPLAVFTLYTVGTGQVSLRWFGFGAACAIVPPALTFTARGRPPGCWQDLVAIAAIGLPVKVHLAHHLWPYPDQLAHGSMIAFEMCIGIAAFIFIRQIEGIGYAADWGKGFGFYAGMNFLIFGAIAIPLGEAIHFIAFGPTLAKVRALPYFVPAVLVFTAWPEEFLFRGLLQNLLSKRFKNETTALLVTSAVFGFSHIGNGKFPNWPYVLLATIAGVFYGRTWQKTRSLTPPTLVHGAVDILWHTLFR